MKNFRTLVLIFVVIGGVSGVVWYFESLNKKELLSIDKIEISEDVAQDDQMGVVEYASDVPTSEKVILNMTEKIESVINMNRDRKVAIDDHSVSPNGRYVLASAGISIFLVDLELHKEIVKDQYFVYVPGEFSKLNHKWLDGQLIIASSWGAYGGEGFPGIVQVDLNTGTKYKIVDMSEECRSYDPAYVCIESYSFEINDVTSGSLIYTENFQGKEETKSVQLK